MQQGVRVGDGVATVTLGDTVISVWVKAATAERFEWQIKELHALAASQPGGAIALSIITEGSTPPDGPLRKKMQQQFKDLGDRLRLFVAVPIGNSVWISVVRTMIRAILLVSGQSGRHAVASSVGEALTKVAGAGGANTPGRAVLIDGVRSAFASLGVAPPPVV